MPAAVRFRRAFVGTAVVLLALALLVQVAALLLLQGATGENVRRQIAEQASEALGSEVRIGGLQSSILNRIVARDVSITRSGRTLIRAKRVVVHYSFLRMAAGRFNPLAAISRIDIEGPEVNARLLKNGQIDLTEIFSTPGQKPADLALRSMIAFKNGTVVLTGLPGDQRARVESLNGYVSLARYPNLRVVADGRLAEPANGRVSVDGRIDAKEGSLEGRVSLDHTPLAEWMKTGLIPGEAGKFGGTAGISIGAGYRDGKLSIAEGRLEWENGTYQNALLPNSLRQIRISASFDGDRLTIHQAAAHSGTSSVSISGGIRNPGAPVFDGLQVKASGLKWNDWSRFVSVPGWEIDGVADASVTLNGPYNRPSITGRVQVAGAEVVWRAMGMRVSGIKADLAVEPEAVRIKRLEGDWEGAHVSLSGQATGWDDPALDVTIRAVKVDMARLSALIPQAGTLAVTGRADLDARVGGKASDPRVTARVTAGSGSVQGGQFKDLLLGLSYARSTMNGTLSVQVMGGSISGWTVWHPFDSKKSVAGEMNLKGVSLNRVMSVTPWKGTAVEGDLSGQFLFRAEAGRPLRVYGTADVPRATVAGQHLGSSQVAFSYADSTLTLESLTSRYGNGILIAHGRLDSQGRLDFEGTGRQIELRDLMKGIGLPGSGTAQLAFKIGGTMNAPSGSATLTVTQAVIRDARLGTLQAEVALDGPAKELTLTRVHLIHPEHLMLATGKYNFGDGSLDVQVDASGVAIVQALRAAGVGQDLPVVGHANMSATITGTALNPQVDGEIHGQSVSIGPESIDSFEAVLAWNGRKLELTKCRIRKGEAFLSLQGTIDAKGALSGDVKLNGLPLDSIVSLKSVAGGVAGYLALDGRISGTITAPEFRGRMDGERISAGGFEFDQIAGPITWTQNKIEFDGFRLEQEGQSYTLLGWLAPGAKGEMDMRLSCDKGNLADLLRAAGLKGAPSISGAMTGFIHVRGGLTKPEGRLIAEIEDGRIGDAPVEGSVDALFGLDLKHAQLSWLKLGRLRLWQGDGVLLATGDYEPEGGSSISISANRFDLRPIMTLIGGQETLSGKVDMALDLTGYPQKPRLNGRITLADGQVVGITYDRVSVVASADERGIRLTDGRIERKGDVATAGGTMPFDGGIRKALAIPESGRPDLPLDLSVKADSIAIDWLGPLIDGSLHIPNGRAELNGHIGGTLSKPDMEGGFKVYGAELEIAGLMLPVVGLEGSGHFKGDRIYVDKVDGSYGAGRVSGGGNLRFVPFAVKYFDFWVKADPVAYSSPMFAGTLKGTATYKGPPESPVLGGEVWISNARLSAVIGPSSGGTPLVMGLDITAHIGDDVRLRQEMTVLDLDVPVEGTLSVRGSLAAPRIEGQITANRGTIVAYRNGFQIIEAQAEFKESRGVIPYVRLLARKPAAGAIIFMRVEGEVGPDLRLQFESNPPLTNEEIFAMLDMPQMLRQDGLTLEHVLNEGIYVVGKAVFDTVGRNVAQWLNVDEFSLVPRGPSLTTDGLELRVGKFLTPQLYLGYSSYYQNQFYQSLGVSYYFSPWSVLDLNYSSTGDFGLGFSLRVRF